MKITELHKNRNFRKSLVALSVASIIGASIWGASLYGHEASPPQPHLAALAQLSSSGQKFEISNLQGKPTAVFFGFTHCLDVCPTTLQRLAMMRKKIGSRFDEIEVVFVTLDPQRDSESQLKGYLESLPLKVTGLTGSNDDITRAAVRFGVYQERVATSENDYAIDHTASLFLIGRDGRQAGEIAIDATEAEFVNKLSSII